MNIEQEYAASAGQLSLFFDNDKAYKGGELSRINYLYIRQVVRPWAWAWAKKAPQAVGALCVPFP